MKVAHVIPYYQEGLGYEENHLGFAQAALGKQVTIVTSDRPLIQWGSTTVNNSRTSDLTHPPVLHNQRYTDRGVAIHRLEPMVEARSHAQLILRGLKSVIVQERPDIMHLHAPSGLLTIQTLWTARALRIPVVIDCHLCYFNLTPYNWMKRVYYGVFRKLILPRFGQTVGRYLPQTPDSAILLMNELGLPPELLTHITLGTDTDQFRFDVSARHRLRSELNIPDEGNVIASIGRVTPSKDVDVLLEASAPLLSQLDLYILIVGPIEDGLEARLAGIFTERQQQRVIFTGYVPHHELFGYFSAADVAVWPGDGAISIIDAMACSLPVILTRGENNRHLVMDGNGYSFTRGDSHDLRRKLTVIFESKQVREEMGRRSRRLAERVFSWDRVAARTIEVYEEVLHGRVSQIEPLWPEMER